MTMPSWMSLLADDATLLIHPLQQVWAGLLVFSLVIVGLGFLRARVARWVSSPSITLIISGCYVVVWLGLWTDLSLKLIHLKGFGGETGWWMPAGVIATQFLFSLLPIEKRNRKFQAGLIATLVLVSTLQVLYDTQLFDGSLSPKEITFLAWDVFYKLSLPVLNLSQSFAVPGVVDRWLDVGWWFSQRLVEIWLFVTIFISLGIGFWLSRLFVEPSKNDRSVPVSKNDRLFASALLFLVVGAVVASQAILLQARSRFEPIPVEESASEHVLSHEAQQVLSPLVEGSSCAAERISIEQHRAVLEWRIDEQTFVMTMVHESWRKSVKHREIFASGGESLAVISKGKIPVGCRDSIHDNIKKSLGKLAWKSQKKPMEIAPGFDKISIDLTLLHHLIHLAAVLVALVLMLSSIVGTTQRMAVLLGSISLVLGCIFLWVKGMSAVSEVLVLFGLSCGFLCGFLLLFRCLPRSKAYWLGCAFAAGAMLSNGFAVVLCLAGGLAEAMGLGSLTKNEPQKGIFTKTNGYGIWFFLSLGCLFAVILMGEILGSMAVDSKEIPEHPAGSLTRFDLNVSPESENMLGDLRTEARTYCRKRGSVLASSTDLLHSRLNALTGENSWIAVTNDVLPGDSVMISGGGVIGTQWSDAESRAFPRRFVIRSSTIWKNLAPAPGVAFCRPDDSRDENLR